MSATDSPIIVNADCIEAMRGMPANSIDAIVTDPPYGLGFMGKQWDDLPPGLDFAVEALRVLKPGGHLLAFGGTRTWHRLAVAIEDAGFEIRDSIAWMYGSGFPKSLDVSKAIDKSGGNAHLAPQIAAAIKAARVAHGWTVGRADAEFCGGSTLYSWYEGRPKGIRTPMPREFALMVEAWPELVKWADAVAEVERETTGRHAAGIGVGTSGPGGAGEGKERRDNPATDAARQWQGWGTALKPAFEPIVVARKPLVGTVAANVLEHGTGALNIDGARIGEAPSRFPTNVILDQSQACSLDEQGDAARFFYCAKAPKSERPVVNGVAHPTVKPLALMRYLVRLVTPPGGVVLDPFAGSGTTVEAALLDGFQIIGIEREVAYLPLIEARIARGASITRAPTDLALFDDIQEAS
ncbi:DNA-methyltransferase [Clavibacter capsici]|uniref:DNA-methyltransferase n=1 Tax=Clavibacter capsici TaxID=1874630 RepID=UPI00287B9D50|nr:site-specific DNA-methyltransferase [Clavibacter capsici]